MFDRAGRGSYCGDKQAISLHDNAPISRPAGGLHHGLDWLRMLLSWMVIVDWLHLSILLHLIPGLPDKHARSTYACTCTQTYLQGYVSAACWHI
jgi:hypothetical protein